MTSSAHWERNRVCLSHGRSTPGNNRSRAQRRRWWRRGRQQRRRRMARQAGAAAQPRRPRRHAPGGQAAAPPLLPARESRGAGTVGGVERERGDRRSPRAPSAGQTAAHRLGRGHHHRAHEALAVLGRLRVLPERYPYAEELSFRRAGLPAGRAMLVRPLPPSGRAPADADRHGTCHRQSGAHRAGRHLERLPRRLPALVHRRALPRFEPAR